MKKIISIFLLFIFLLSSCGSAQTVVDSGVKPKYVKTETITKQPFSEDVKLIGKISGGQETMIAPLTSGMIKKVNVKIGDKVKAGDILAVIDTQSNLTNVNLNNAQNTYANTLNVYYASKDALEKNLDTSKLQYDNAVSTRDNTYDSTQKQLELAQTQLDGIKTQKGNTAQTSKTSIELAKQTLTAAQLNLDNFSKNYTETMKGFDVKRTSLVNNMKVAIDNSFATLDGALYLVDTVLGVTPQNRNANVSFEIYLSAKNPSYKDDAKVLFSQVNTSYNTLKQRYNAQLSQDDIMKYYSDLMSFNNKVITLFDKMSSVMDNSIPSSTFTDSTLSGLKTSMKTYQSQIITLNSNLVSLNNSLIDLNNTIDTTKVSLDTQKASLVQSISTSQASLNNTQVSVNSSIDSVSSQENTTKVQLESTLASIKTSREAADNAVKIAENQYNAAKANYQSQLASTKTQLDNASGQKSSVNQQYDNALIKAPFDGIISAKNVEIGTSVSQSTQAFSISNTTNKVIKIDANADNIAYFQFGKEVKIDVKGNTATGYISALSTSIDPNTKMYKVEISFNNPTFNNSIVIGDYADVYINKTYGEAKYIVVPFSSIIVGSNEEYSVYVVDKNNLVQEKKVTTGASNSSEVVITDGLDIGDKVIISGALNVSVGDLVSDK